MFSSKAMRGFAGILTLTCLLVASSSAPELHAQGSAKASANIPLFSALHNQTLIAAYASRAKALGSPAGDIQQYQYSVAAPRSPWCHVHFRLISKMVAECGGSVWVKSCDAPWTGLCWI